MPLSANETMISTREIAVPLTNTDLPGHRGIYVGGAGDLSVLLYIGTTVTIPAVPAGTLLPLEVKQIKSAGTTATNLVLWK